jgi:protein farnesyltransferase subunit beta
MFATRKMRPSGSTSNQSLSGSSSRISGPDEDPTDSTMTVPPVPPLFTQALPLRDDLETLSSEMQDANVAECLPFLTLDEIDPALLNGNGVPRLDRQKHIRFLRATIEAVAPPQFVAMDASRPWIVYWALAGLYMLGEDVGRYRQK